jgi:hypothetical protein
MPGEIQSAFGNGPQSLSAPSTDTSGQQQTAQAQQIPAMEHLTLPGMTIGGSEGAPAGAGNTPGAPPVATREPSGDWTDVHPSEITQSQNPVAPQSTPAAPFQGGAPSDILRNMSAGKTPAEQKMLLDHMLGQGNTTQIDNQLYFRKPGENTFQPVTASLGDALSGAIKGDSSGLISLINSHYYGMKGAVDQTSGAVIGGTLGELAMPLGGGIAGATAAAGASAAKDSYDRNEAVSRILGNKLDPNANLSQSLSDGETAAMWNMGGSIAMQGLSSFAGYVAKATMMSAENRMQSMMQIRNSLSSFASSFSGNTLDEIGANTKGLLQMRANSDTLYNLYLSKWENSAKQFMDQTGSRIDVGPVVSKLDDLMSPYVTFKGDFPIMKGSVSSSGAGADMSFEQLERANSASLPGMPAIPSNAPAQQVPSAGLFDSMFSDVAPFGSPNGSNLLKKFLDMRENLTAAQKLNGGLDFQAFSDLQKQIGNTTKWDTLANQMYHPADKAAYETLYGSFIDARNGLYKTALGQTPGAYDAYLQDYAQYGIDKDAAKSLYDIFGKDDAATGLMMQSAIKSKSPDPILDIKTLLGDDPSVTKQLKGAAVQSIMSDAMSQNKNTLGLMNTQALKSSFDAINPEILKQVFEPAELNQLRAFVTRANKIPTMDLAGPADKSVIQDAAKFGLLAAGKGMGASGMAHTLYSLTGGNEKAYDYMANEALPNLLEQANVKGDFGRVNQISGVIQKMFDYKFLSKPVNNGSRSILIPGPELRQMFLNNLGGTGQQTQGSRINTNKETVH